jgi:hypothetical protein
VGPRPLSAVVGRPLNFTVRWHMARHPHAPFLALSLLCAVASFASSTCPKPDPLYPHAKISRQQMDDLVASVKLRPGTHCKQFAPLQLQCNSDSLPEIWWFTESGHPAHPAASRGQIMRNVQTGQTCLIRDGYFAGQEPAFAEWMNELKQYDKQTVERVLGNRDGAT